VLSFTKVNKKVAWLCGGILFIVGISAYYIAYLSFSNGEHSIIPQEAQVVKQETGSKITKNTELVQKILYLKCKDEEILRTKPTDNLVGLNSYQIQKIYQGWVFDKFDNNEVNMTLKVDSYCREHINNMFIGIHDGHVAVFYGKPDYKPIVKETTSIQINKLMPQDVEELEHGMIVQSNEELLRTLEGMQSR
jgi:hypothetical protein